MDTNVMEIKQGKFFNRSGEEIIPCVKGCGRATTMLGTGLCDECWERERHAPVVSGSKRTIKASELKKKFNMEPIIGQEAICPDGLGRVIDFDLHSAINNFVKVVTYVKDRSCEWDPRNVELIDPRK